MLNIRWDWGVGALKSHLKILICKVLFKQIYKHRLNKNTIQIDAEVFWTRVTEQILITDWNVAVCNAIHYGKQIRGKVTKKHNTYVVFVIWNESEKKKVLDKHLICLLPLIITNMAIEYFDIINTMLCIVWAKTILTQTISLKPILLISYHFLLSFPLSFFSFYSKYWKKLSTGVLETPYKSVSIYGVGVFVWTILHSGFFIFWI